MKNAMSSNFWFRFNLQSKNKNYNNDIKQRNMENLDIWETETINFRAVNSLMDLPLNPQRYANSCY